MPYVNANRIVELTGKRGWNQAHLAATAIVDVDTIGHIFAAARRGELARRCAVKTATQIAGALNIDLSTILCDGTGRPLTSPACNAIGSWLVKSQGEQTKAVNGLLWTEYELVHVEDDEKARAKAYDLHNPPTREQSAIAACLKRHRVVCKRVGKHPNVALNLDIVHDPIDRKRWWVIDEWVSATKLTHLLARGALPHAQLVAVLRGVADGLATLHAVDVIRRDLAPRSILITEQSAVLTDFELAKLPGALPTVAANAEWPEEVYRAPEVAGAVELTPTCDLYSWAMILAHASTGRLPRSPGNAKTLLRAAGLPKRLTALASQCLDPPAARPRAVTDLLAALRRWR